MSTCIGDIIRKRREELGLTQEELAKKMGYKSKSTINKIEMGINDVSQSKIMLFAKALNTAPSFLMGWTETKNGTDAVNEINLDSIIKTNPEIALTCIGLIIRTLRIDRDLTEKTVANNSGVSIGEYVKLENEYINIGIENISKIIISFGINMFYIHGMLTGMIISFENSKVDKEQFIERIKDYLIYMRTQRKE